MRVVFYRPFAEIWFKNPTRRILRKERMPNKYEAWFDHMLRHGCAAVSTSLVYREGVAGWSDLLKDTLRLVLWVVINRINPLKVQFVLTRRQLEKADALVLMHYGNFTHEDKTLAQKGAALAHLFANTRVKKIVHLTHYLYNPVIGAANLRALRPDLLLAENDLKQHSRYYQKHFHDVSGAFYQLPYVAAGRFQKKVAFEDRLNKLGVTGSITYKLQDAEFLDFFGVNELQPMRRKLYEQRERNAGQMDCFIYDLNESRRVATEPSGDAGSDQQAQAMAQQRSYYNADIVAFFNRYTMFAVPEEICDLPGISFIEGMACGTAYFGKDDPMYTSLGMVPGVHYVAYDGSVEGLLEKVSYYQAHAEELKQIADQGYRFAHGPMDGETVYSALRARVEKLLVSP